VQVPTGFLNITIELDSTVDADSLARVPVFVRLTNKGLARSDSVPTTIGTSRTFVLTPGTYEVYAIIAEVSSEPVAVSIVPGEVKKIVFHFGRSQ